MGTILARVPLEDVPVTSPVTIDPDLCIGSSECVRIAPDAFAIDEASGVSIPLPGAAAADPGRLDEAERSCPTGALRRLRTIGSEQGSLE